MALPMRLLARWLPHAQQQLDQQAAAPQDGKSKRRAPLHLAAETAGEVRRLKVANLSGAGDDRDLKPCLTTNSSGFRVYRRFIVRV
jgi:hypothetical protein